MDSNKNFISLSELSHVVLDKKWYITFVVFLFTFGSIFYAYMKPNIYSSSSLVSIVSNSTDQSAFSLSDVAPSFSNILGNKSKKEDTIRISLLTSQVFINEFISKHNLDSVVIAAEGWDNNKKELIYNSDRYDTKQQKWLPRRKFFGLIKTSDDPTPQPMELHAAFKAKYLNVSEDVHTGLIIISIQHFSPTLAKQWLDWLLADINTFIRRRDVKWAKSNLTYLSKEIETTALSDIRNVFSRMINEQLKTIMLSEAQEQYAFRVIDPPFLPVSPIKPRRIMIIILGTCIGFLGSITYFIILFRVRSDRETDGS